MLHFRPFSTLVGVGIEDTVNDPFNEEMGPPEPRLLLVLDDRAEFVSRLATFAGDDCRLADGDVEATSEDTVDRCDGVSDVVPFTFAWSTREANKDALIVLPWGNAESSA